MSKRAFVWLFWPLLGVWAMWVLWATGAYAQERPIDPKHQGYLLYHPIDPNMMILATTTGRFSIRVWEGCEGGFIPNQIVRVGGLYGTVEDAIMQGYGPSPVLGIGIGVDRYWCALAEATLVDTTPCFTNAEGACDVALELVEVN